MTAKKIQVKGVIGFEVKNMFVKTVTKSGNAGHVAMPKNLIKRKVIVIVPERQIDLSLIQNLNQLKRKH